MLASQYVRGKGAPVTQRGIMVEEPRGDLVFSEYFNRADETPPSDWTVQAGTWDILNYYCRQTALTLGNYIYRSDVDRLNGEFRCIFCPQEDGGDSQGGIGARWIDVNNRWNIELDVAAQVIRLQKNWKGVETNVVSSGTMLIPRGIQFVVKLLLYRRYIYGKVYRLYGAVAATLFYRDLLNLIGTGKLYIKGNRTCYFDDVEVYPFSTPSTFEDSFAGAGMLGWQWDLHRYGRLNGSYYTNLYSAALGNEHVMLISLEEFVGENMEVEAEFYLTKSTSVGVVARANDKNNLYLCQIMHVDQKLKIYRKKAGSYTEIGSASITFGLNEWHKLKLRVNGGTLTAYFKDVETLTITDKNGEYSLDYGGAGLRFDYNADATQVRNFKASLLSWVGLTNLAKTATVSVSSEYGAGYEKEKAIDENTATRWASKSTTGPHWIKLDLASAKTISQIVIRWEILGNFSTLKIEYSNDDITYTEWFSTNDRPPDNTTLAYPVTGINARYWRVTETVSAANPMSLWEIQLFEEEAL